MEGVLGCGTLIVNCNPASSTALDVLSPKAPMTVPFCLNAGALSNKLLTPLGVKKQITSYSFAFSTWVTSLLCVRYINARANSQLFAFSHPVISLSCWFSEHTYRNFSFPLCLLITSIRLLLLPSAP